MSIVTSSTQKRYFQIDGIFCYACCSIITSALEQIEGIEQVQLNYVTGMLRVLSDKEVKSEEIIQVITSKGYRATESEDALSFEKDSYDFQSERRKILFGFLLSVPLVHNPWFCLNPFIQWFFASVILLLLGGGLYKNALYTLSDGKANMSVLIFLGTLSAYLYSVCACLKILPESEVMFEACGTVLVFVSISRYLEASGKMESSDRLLRLMHIIPLEVCKLEGEIVRVCPVTEIAPGDRIYVDAGQVIPLDGVIEKGHTQIDDSTLSGEAEVKVCTAGDKVYASNITGFDPITIRVSTAFKDTLFSRLLENALDSYGNTDSKVQTKMDALSGIFLRTVLCIAVVSFFAWYGFIKPGDLLKALRVAISILVVSCPCTLALCVSMCMNAAISELAKHGIFVRSHAAIEKMSEAETFFFDKTGTLTSSKASAAEILVDAHREEKILSYVLSLEDRASHPIARKLKQEYAENRILPIENFTYENGVLSGDIEGKHVEIRHQVVYVDQQVVGKITYEESIRAGSSKLIDILKMLRKRVVLISGDKEENVRKTAKALGIEEFWYGQSPLDKSELLRKTEGVKVMVGDGINDLAAMNQADVSIAIGRWMDIFSDSSDIRITQDRILDVLKVIYVSRKAVENIELALKISFTYNLFAIALCCAGLLNAVLASSLMAISSLTTVVITRKLKGEISRISFAKILEVQEKKKSV